MIKELVSVDPQPAVRKNAEHAEDWPYKEQAAYLYRMAVLMRERLIDPIARIDRQAMPDPVISFSDLRNYNTLAGYRLIRNPQGLNYEITFNSVHYVGEPLKWNFGEWALLETLAHELVHEWQQTVGKDPIKVGRVYHNREFVDKCESVGLHPKLGEGYHLQLATEPFSLLMKELGISPPEIPEGDITIDWFKFLSDFEGKKKGRSSLIKWSCGCQNVRVGTKEFHALCTLCGNEFKPVAVGMLGVK